MLSPHRSFAAACRSSPALALLLRATAVVLGAFMAVLACGMFLVAGLALSSRVHEVRASDREHLEAAVKFVRERYAATGTIPDSEEFDRWGRSMDANGDYRFEGRGYALDKKCSSDASGFCIHYWTGDESVAYRSWQGSMETVRLVEWPPSYALFLLVLGGLAATGSRLLFLAAAWRPS